MGWCAPSSLITVLMLAELDMSSTIELASAEAPTGAPSAYRLNLCPVCELPLIPRHVDDYCCKGHLKLGSTRCCKPCSSHRASTY